MDSSKKFKTIDEYIALFPNDVQTALEELRQTIKKEASGAEETIGYGIPTFKLHGNLVHFAAYKKHIGFYPGGSSVRFFAKKLSSYKTSKGTIQFPIDKPIPLVLVREIVKFRVKENLGRIR